ncbi:GDP-mannose 4,6-dehydratase [Isoptericola croceus]|uniref:GDP-mannose 4,6-dehydratase n=1 Tax=Isoptericola croceus TaxID=3031406 RepID=UPI0023F8176B|nr:GDP-mannose 4,6-dehydratase [Isoptericola croceus]
MTGIAGQDGSYLAQRLVDEGLEVHGLVLARDRTPDQVPAGAHLHEADLRDTVSLASVVRDVAPDEIYNLGGISSVAYSWEHPVATGAVNGLGAAALFEEAWRVQEYLGRPVRVVQASSAEVFGTPDRTPQDEDTAVRPVSPYGAAKAYAHHMAGVFRSRGLGVSSCVLYNHESPRRPTSFVTRKITAAAARIAHDGGGTIALGNLSASRDWGWAPDYVDAMVRAARHPTAEDFVVASGESHSVEEFVAAAFTAAGIDDWRAHVAVDERFFRPVDTAQQVGDPRKAQELLGWRRTVGFDELVTRMVQHDRRLLAA